LLSSFIHKAIDGDVFFRAKRNNFIVIEEETSLGAIFASHRPVLAVKMQPNPAFKKRQFDWGFVGYGAGAQPGGISRM
jgi:hypothetical protein